MAIARNGKFFEIPERPRDFLKAQLMEAKCLQTSSDHLQQGTSIVVFCPGVPVEYAEVLRLELVRLMERQDELQQEEKRRQAHFESMKTSLEELTELRKIRDSVLFIKSLFK